MALNRLTTILYPTKFLKLWINKHINILICSQIIFSIVIEMPFIPFETKYVEDLVNGSLYSFYVDEKIAIIADVKEFIIISLITFMILIINCLTLYMLKRSSFMVLRNNKTERTIFIYSALNFVTLFILNINLCFTIFGTSMGLDNLKKIALDNFSFVMDMITLLDVPIFFAISKEIRNEVLSFYLRRCHKFRAKVRDITIL